MYLVSSLEQILIEMYFKKFIISLDRSLFREFSHSEWSVHFQHSNLFKTLPSVNISARNTSRLDLALEMSWLNSTPRSTEGSIQTLAAR